MKLHYTWIAAILTSLIATPNVGAVTDPETLRDDLEELVRLGCPERYRDVTVQIGANSEDIANPPGNDSEVLWTDANDKTDFINQYNLANPPEDGLPANLQLDFVIDSVEAIQFECNAHRLAFLQLLMTINEDDATASIATAEDVIGSIAFTGTRWLPGDIRITARSFEASGWVFLQGQTIGSESSGATLSGIQYRALFDIAKSMQNSPVPDWDTGIAATLPDMRGKTLYGAGTAGFQTIGGNAGAASVPLTPANMPQHNHSMTEKMHSHGTVAGGVHYHNSQTTGHHGHPMGTDTHSHTLRTSVFGGSGAGQTTYPYFQGMARVNYQNTIPQASAVLNDTHSHSLTSAGNHKHTIYNSASHGHSVTGNGNHAHANTPSGSTTPTKVSTMSPGLVFNVEIKL